MIGIDKKKVLVLIVFVGILFISGCVEEKNIDWNDGATNEAEAQETISEVQETISEVQEMTPETQDIVQKDAAVTANEYSWGLDDMKDLFESWGWYPSTDPTNIEEIAERAGVTVNDIEEQKEKIKEIILNIPKMKKNDAEISFFTDSVKTQFTSVEWGKYTFDECEVFVFAGDPEGLWGRVYLRNSNDAWKCSKPAIFLTFHYTFDLLQFEIIELIETTSGVEDYKLSYYYGDDEAAMEVYEVKGTRLLDMALELNQVDEFIPIAGLEGEELKRYVERIFLDLYRCPNHLYKYKGVFSEDTISLLETAEYYYDKPKEIYDFAELRFGEGKVDTVYIGSQFQTAIWQQFIIEIDIDIKYNKMTGEIVVNGGLLNIVEKD